MVFSKEHHWKMVPTFICHYVPLVPSQICIRIWVPKTPHLGKSMEPPNELESILAILVFPTSTVQVGCPRKYCECTWNTDGAQCEV